MTFTAEVHATVLNGLLFLYNIAFHTLLMLRGMIMQQHRNIAADGDSLQVTDQNCYTKNDLGQCKIGTNDVGDYKTDDAGKGKALFHQEFLQSIQTHTGRLCARVLLKKTEIIDAQALIYQMYFEEEEWQWSVDNPTGFQIQDVNGKKVITDNFDDSSFWIGAFLDEELVSCIRVVYRTDCSKLDIEGYQNSNKSALKAVLAGENIIEMQRCVTKPNYRYKGLNFLVINVLAKLLVAKSVTAVATSQISFVSTYGVGTTLDEQFDYGDGVHVKAMFWSLDDIQQILKKTLQAVKALKYI